MMQLPSSRLLLGLKLHATSLVHPGFKQASYALWQIPSQEVTMQYESFEITEATHSNNPTE